MARTARKFRIGVIGAGAIAQACHIPGYVKAGNCELSAIADPNDACLKEVAGRGWRFRAVYHDYREMLAREKLDAISICTPNALHKEQAVAAAATGADILLEKPVVLSMDEARAVRQAVRRHGNRVMVGFSHRFSPHNVLVHKKVQAGAIGRPYMIRIRFAHMGPWPGWAKTDWFYNPALAGGGALLDMGIHAFDLARWIVGEATAVQARIATLRKKIRVDDNAVVVLEFGGKCLGCIEVGWTSPSGFVGLEVMGDKGSITVDYAAQKTTMTAGATRPDGGRRLRTTVLLESLSMHTWDEEMAHFTSMLGNHRPFRVGLEDGVAALKLALAAYKSGRTGRRVAIR